MEEVIETLRNEEPLAPKYRDHLLSGKFEGYSELHITPDLLLVYIITGNRVTEIIELSPQENERRMAIGKMCRMEGKKTKSFEAHHVPTPFDCSIYDFFVLITGFPYKYTKG